MMVINSKAFADALDAYPAASVAIKSLFSFLHSNNFSDAESFLSTLPNANALGYGRIELKIASTNLYFVGKFDFRNGIVMVVHISNNSATES